MLWQFGGKLLSNLYPHFEVAGLEAASSDGAFDRIAELARFLIDADVAVVSLNDAARNWAGESHKRLNGSVAFVGPNADIRSQEVSIEALANPLTAMGRGFVSHASVPIRMGMERVGTLAVLSREDRYFDDRAVETLHRLAELVGEGLLLRLDELELLA